MMQMELKKIRSFNAYSEIKDTLRKSGLSTLLVKLIYGIISAKGPNACYFKISTILILQISEMLSTHSVLRTENRSFRHGVARLCIFN